MTHKLPHLAKQFIKSILISIATGIVAALAVWKSLEYYLLEHWLRYFG